MDGSGALLIAALAELLGAVVLIATTHLAGVGRLPRNRIAGIRVRSTLASDDAWRAAHRAATPIVWLTGGIAGIAAVAALAFAGADSARERLVLVLLAAIVLLVGAALACWRGIATVR